LFPVCRIEDKYECFSKIEIRFKKYEELNIFLLLA
jgi:hypothetical protein